MRHTLTLVHDDPGLKSRLDAALDVTRALRGRLTCLDLTIPIVVSGLDPSFGAAVLEPETRSEVQAQARLRMERSRVPFDWEQRRGDLKGEITALAESADVVVLSSPRELSYPDMRGPIGEVLVVSRKPVIAVPTCAKGIKVNDQVMLLWDGSHESRAAMGAALPLLRQAAKVTILQVNDGSVKIPAHEACDYLTQRNVIAEVRIVPAFGEKAAFPILQQIELLGPAYVVMGGFGHSRLIEGLFGGVTERLLKESPVPLFLKN